MNCQCFYSIDNGIVGVVVKELLIGLEEKLDCDVVTQVNGSDLVGLPLLSTAHKVLTGVLLHLL